MIMKHLTSIILLLYAQNVVFSQKEYVSGKIINKETSEKISNAIITIRSSSKLTKTDLKGEFKLSKKLPLGEQVLKIEKEGFITKKIPIVINKNAKLNLGDIELSTDFKSLEQEFTIINLSEDVDNNNQTVLQAYKDPYLKSVAYNWSSTFFKIRGLGSSYSKILINGIEMNKAYNNRPNWSNWTGLNDILKSQENTSYSRHNTSNFGNLNGITAFNINSGSFSKSKKISLSSTNRSYQGRIMATYHSGEKHNKYNYSFSTSARKAEQGYFEGTNLNAFAFFGAFEYKINNKNKLNLSIIYTPITKGKTSPNTQEVTDIKGVSYNSYWGYQNGQKRNSRIKTTEEPIIILSHYFKTNNKLSIQNNLLVQKGTVTNSRIDFTGSISSTQNGQVFFEGIGNNPDPTYYQRLPSYFLRNKENLNFESAYLSEQELKNNGQIEWDTLFLANSTNTNNAIYALYNDTNEDFFTAINSILNYQYSKNLSIDSKIAYRYTNSHNYAQVLDLFGANSFLDIDAFSIGNEAQNDLRNPNKLVKEGDFFKYNYNLYNHNINGFIQANFTYKKYNLNTAFYIEQTNTYRKGNFENGHFIGDLSLGKSTSVNYLGIGGKLNFNYQLNPKTIINSNLYYKEDTPTLQNIYTNARQSNLINSSIKNETNTSLDLNIRYQYNGIKLRLSNYWISRKNGNESNFFYSQDIANLGRVDNADFFQELVSNRNTQNIGLEFGAEIDVTNTLSLQFSGTISDHRYTNNPTLQITSDSQSEPVFTGKTNLKGYKLATGPQQAFGIGFNYRDPNYWWFATQINFFKNSYSNISAFNRTVNFSTDIDGITFSDFNEERAKELLEQEKFASYMLWNAIGGKSWRVKTKYIGITIGLQNILNTIYKTGGFEQTRNSNFQDLNEDQTRDTPLFSSKYWYGSGSTFYVNTYIHF